MMKTALPTVNNQHRKKKKKRRRKKSKSKQANKQNITNRQSGSFVL